MRSGFPLLYHRTDRKYKQPVRVAVIAVAFVRLALDYFSAFMPYELRNLQEVRAIQEQFLRQTGYKLV